jgi:hopanoid biosynthesis associated protein HpnK
MKKLIVNADDFGLHTLINQGIIKGFRDGFITSASLMPSAPAYAEAVELAQANPDFGVGIHLTLVGGVPPLLPPEQVPTLVDARGLFPDSYVEFAKRFYLGRVNDYELECELRAQIERALASGVRITHLDSHQHTHVLPFVNKLVLKLCNEYNIKRVRIPREDYFFSGGFHAGFGRRLGRCGLSFCAEMAALAADSLRLAHPRHFFGMLAGGHLTPSLVGNILRSLPEGTSELMTHPGLDTATLARSFAWGYTWETELSSYLAEENKELLRQLDIQLINFADL